MPGCILINEVFLFVAFFEVPRTCYDLKLLGVTKSGKYLIDPDGPGIGDAPFEVFCDMEAEDHCSICSSWQTTIPFKWSGKNKTVSTKTRYHHHQPQHHKWDGQRGPLRGSRLPHYQSDIQYYGPTDQSSDWLVHWLWADYSGKRLNGAVIHWACVPDVYMRSTLLMNSKQVILPSCLAQSSRAKCQLIPYLKQKKDFMATSCIC